MTDSDRLVMWRDKRIDDMTREELIDALNALARTVQDGIRSREQYEAAMDLFRKAKAA